MADLNLRAVVVDALTSGLPEGWTVIGYPDIPERLSGRTACVWAASLAPMPEAPSTYLTTLTVEVLTDRQDPRTADDDLDAALLEVLQILWDTPGVLFDSAERTTNEKNTYHAWTLTVRAAFTTTLED